jgi:fibronectin type 3 domain-containing protein
MTRITLSVFVALMLTVASETSAQSSSQQEAAIAVLVRPWSDSIAIRWAPTTFSIWEQGNKSGYRVERFVIARKGQLLPTPEKVILHPSIFPWEEHRWEPLVMRDPYAAIAAQALFGERFEIKTEQRDVFSIVSKVRENEQRHGFALFCADMSTNVARASGLWFTDRSVTDDERYLYRIILNHSDSTKGSAFTFTNAPYALVPPQSLQATFQEGIAQLRWERDATGLYTAYVVERSTDGARFSAISDTPLVNTSPGAFEDARYLYALDSLPTHYQRYHYRVRGITAFGELSDPSELVSGVATRSVTQNPHITAAEPINNKSIQVTWTFPTGDDVLISGFRIERASNPAEGFQSITRETLPSSLRAFEDVSPMPSNYYRVTALGLDGRSYRSHSYYAQLIDSIPPAPPAGLKATVTDDGLVTLTWARNSEADLYGYRVFRSYYTSEEPAQITREPVIEEQLIDTLNLHALNKHVYYSVTAVDHHQNRSPLTPPLKVSLPDRVKPHPPVLLPAQTDNDRVVIRWTRSPSTDVVHYKIYRHSGDDKWEEVAIVNAESDSLYRYSDLNTDNGELHYTILAVDDAGLESEPPPPVAASAPRRNAEPVRWSKPRLNYGEGNVVLAWTYKSDDVTGYRLYKSVDHQPLQLYRFIPAGEFRFSDALLPEATYTYRIIALHRNGTLSAMSDALTFSY